jgi:hypothetical protein
MSSKLNLFSSAVVGMVGAANQRIHKLLLFLKKSEKRQTCNAPTVWIDNPVPLECDLHRHLLALHQNLPTKGIT